MLDVSTAAVRALAVPYGYTLVIWSSGALAIATWGIPRRRDVLLFVLGATLGYLLWDIPVLALNGRPASFSVVLPGSASLNVLPILPALLLASLVRRIPSRPLGFLLSGLIASATYIAALVALLTLSG